MSARKELLEKASGLGLTFPKNISTEKLENLVVTAMEENVKPPAVKEEPPTEPPVAVKKETKSNSILSELDARQTFIAKSKQKAFATSVVTLTNKDNRENDVMTTAYLSFENQHFGLSKIVPLDVPAELEQALIRVAESTMITLHKDEIVDGKRTGNKKAVSVKKFAVSYEKNQD